MSAGRVRVVCAVVCLALAAAGSGWAGGALAHERVGEVVFEVERSADAQATYAACAEVVRMLNQRGWDTDRLHVRIQANPFDATVSPADIVLGASEPSEDSAFILATAIVERQLARGADPATARVLAESVAAHLSAPSASSRLRWELSWLARLSQGDILTTALPEALWRAGSDAAIRLGARGGWPQSAVDSLAASGVDNPLHAVGEIAVAGLLDPEALGFHRPTGPTLPSSITQRDLSVRFAGAGIRIVALPQDAGALAVLPLQSNRVESWVAVRYALTGGFDAVALTPRTEITVPLQGVAWAGILVTGMDADSSVSLAVRPVADYPVRIKRWDFLAGDQNVTLSWETQRQEGLRAFIVEALGGADGGPLTVVRRTMIPVADNGDASFGYSFVDEVRGNISAYRLLALTEDGFLAEVGSFPLQGQP
jgi:hypothetical protein